MAGQRKSGFNRRENVTPTGAATKVYEIDVKNREIWIYKRPRCCHPIGFRPFRMTASERDFSFLRPHLFIDMKAIAPSLRRNLTLQALVLVTLTPGLILQPVPVRANPQGPNVVAGNVNFQGLNSARLNINNHRTGDHQLAVLLDRSRRGHEHQPRRECLHPEPGRVRQSNGDSTVFEARGVVCGHQPERIAVHEGGSLTWPG